MAKTRKITYCLWEYVPVPAIPKGFIPFVIACIFCFSAGKSVNAAEKAEILNEFMEARKEKNQQKGLDMWLNHQEKIPELDDTVFVWASENEAYVLRRGIIRKMAPQNLGENSVLLDHLQNFLRVELLYIKNLKNNNEADLESLRVCFEQVKKYKMRQIFYETAMYIAYPLIDIRQAAYSAIEVIKDDRIIPLILRLAKSDSPIERTYALDALYYINDDRTIPLLISSLKDKNKSVRYYAIRTLEKMKATTAIPYFLRIIQEDLDNEVRIKAIQAVSLSKPGSGLSVLNKNLSDKDLSVRAEILKALLKYSDSSSAHYVSEQLVREKDDNFKLSLITSLFNFKGTGGMHGLNRIIERDKIFTLRIWAIYVTGYYADKKGLDTLVKALKDENAEIRAEAAAAIGNYKNKKNCADLLQLLRNNNDSYAVHASALYALEQINHEGVLTTLFDLSENHMNLLLREQIKETVRNMLARRWPAL